MKPSLALQANRAAIRRIVAAHRATNPRVFGSVLYGADTEGSDLDLLVDPLEGSTLFDLGGIVYDFVCYPLLGHLKSLDWPHC